MNILTVYAHPNPKSFCHAVLDQFTAGLKDAGHTSEIVDLYATRFDPVFNTHDFPSYVDESMPVDMLEGMNLKQLVLDSSGGPFQRFIVSRWLRNKDLLAVVRLIRSRMPKEIVAQQAKVANAQGLAFIAPVYWLGLPAILKGWFERVFTPGFAYSLTPEGWHGDVKGRVPLLHHDRALIISTTFFKQDAYQGGIEDAMTRLIDDWGLRYPGVREVEHVYFYGVPVVDDETRRNYLERAYCLGKEFASC